MFIKLASQKTPEIYLHQKEISNETNSLVQKLKNEHWEKFSKGLEGDFYKTQKRNIASNNTTKKRAEIKKTNKISEKEWIQDT